MIRQGSKVIKFSKICKESKIRSYGILNHPTSSLIESFSVGFQNPIVSRRNPYISEFPRKFSTYSDFKSDYEGAVKERAAQRIVPKPLDAENTTRLVELLKNPPSDCGPSDQQFLLDLLTNRVPPGVDEAAYVKAAFLSAIAKGEAKSPIVTPEKATELLSTMQGGYNIATLVHLLDHPSLGSKAADGLINTILMFEAFFDVEAKAKSGNVHAQRVMQSWADAKVYIADIIVVVVHKSLSL